MKNWMLLLCVALGCALAQAEEGPKLTRILVGYGPGGGADVITRAYADAIAARLKRTVIVENKPGVGGTLAVASVRNAPADGSVLVFGNVLTHVLAASTFRTPPYDEARDFVPIGEMARFDLALAVGPSTPAKTLADYISWARADAKRASFGTAAAGSLPHFFGLLLGKAAGLDMVHVAYKSGPAINTELIGGALPAAISAPSDYVQLHKAGRLRILATSGAARTRFTPDVPTFKELGYPQLTGTSFFALFAPAGIAPAERARLVAAVQDARSDPRVRKVVEDLGVDLPDGNVDEFAALLASERKRWGDVVKASGFTTEN